MKLAPGIYAGHGSTSATPAFPMLLLRAPYPRYLRVGCYPKFMWERDE